MNGMAQTGTVVQQRLSRCDVPVPYPVQAHLLLHLFDLIAGGFDERPACVQLSFVDLKLGRVLLDDTCKWSVKEKCRKKDVGVQVSTGTLVQLNYSSREQTDGAFENNGRKLNLQ